MRIAADPSPGSRQIPHTSTPKNPRPHRRGGGRRSRSNEGRDAMVVKSRGKDLVMGEVKILKRGEKMMVRDVKKVAAVEKTKKMDGLVLRSTDPIGPEPGILPVQMKLVDHKVTAFAGSGFLVSPAPSELPKPSFLFMRKDLVDRADLATKTLRYLSVSM